MRFTFHPQINKSLLLWLLALSNNTKNFIIRKYARTSVNIYACVAKVTVTYHTYAGTQKSTHAHARTARPQLKLKRALSLILHSHRI